MPKYCAFEKSANLSESQGDLTCGQGLWFAVMPTSSHQVPLCTCVSACMCVWHTEKRAGTTSLVRWRLMVDEWHSRCLSIFSSKHPRQAGIRGSWEHEVVQLWTVGFQLNWLNWKLLMELAVPSYSCGTQICKKMHFAEDTVKNTQNF